MTTRRDFAVSVASEIARAAAHGRRAALIIYGTGAEDEEFWRKVRPDVIVKRLRELVPTVHKVD